VRKKFLIRAKITDRKGNVLSIAENSYSKTHPIQARFANNVGLGHRIFLHAEIAALIKLKKKDKPFKIHVERFHKNGKPANAKPCAVCDAAIRQWGIKHVEYTV
jgi:deoxycytidylate deaminase